MALKHGTTKGIRSSEILGYMIRNARPVLELPTVENIAMAFGISKSTTQHHINNLVRDGYLRRGDGHRPIELP